MAGFTRDLFTFTRGAVAGFTTLARFLDALSARALTPDESVFTQITALTL